MVKYIAVDFDGTIADHMYPDVGKPVPGAFEWLRKFKEAGAILILWTMRSDDTDFLLVSLQSSLIHDQMRQFCAFRL